MREPNGSLRSDGNLDQIRIYDSALSAANVTTLYNEIECPAVAVTNAFNSVIYTGTGSTQAVTGTGFEPDLVWLKSRSSSSWNHFLQDSIRGAENFLISSLTNAESTTIPHIVDSFDTDGFTVLGNGNSNNNGDTYVAWCWKAGGLSAINNEGSIESIVSANPAAGFSIVSTQSDGSGYLNFGHGLSQAPELVITKFTGQTGEWYTYTSAISNGFDVALKLNSSDAAITAYGTNKWSATSTVVAIGNPQWYFTANVPFITYCFTSISGYQKVGSYSGGTSGYEVTLDFTPRFVMIKNATNAGGWVIVDSQRGSNELYPHISNAEDTTTTNVILGTNKFTLNTTGSWYNASGSTYIYLAIA